MTSKCRFLFIVILQIISLFHLSYGKSSPLKCRISLCPYWSTILYRCIGHLLCTMPTMCLCPSPTVCTFLISAQPFVQEICAWQQFDSRDETHSFSSNVYDFLTKIQQICVNWKFFFLKSRKIGSSTFHFTRSCELRCFYVFANIVRTRGF